MKEYKVPQILLDNPNFISAMKSGNNNLVREIIDARLKYAENIIYRHKKELAQEQSIVDDLNYFLTKYKDENTRKILHKVFGHENDVIDKGKNRVEAMRGMPSLYKDVTDYVDFLNVRIEQLEQQLES